MENQPVNNVSVLLISGFLGSGKTTLVKSLLAQAQAEGRKVAVISNEFGELGIDAALLGEGTQKFIELAGGCICCQLTDDLLDTLEMIHREVAPERILVETSGLALPYEIQLTFWRPPVSAWIREEACVVVVNAAQLWEQEAIEDTFTQQVSAADLLILHKIDLVPPDALPALEARLDAWNPGVPILRASFGGVPSDLLFPHGPREARAPTTTYSLTPHQHEPYVSHELRVPDGLSPADALAWVEARKGIRTKGFVLTTEGVQVIQGVGRRIEITPAEDLGVPPEMWNRVVVIQKAPQRSP